MTPGATRYVVNSVFCTTCNVQLSYVISLQEFQQLYATTNINSEHPQKPFSNVGDVVFKYRFPPSAHVTLNSSNFYRGMLNNSFLFNFTPWQLNQKFAFNPILSIPGKIKELQKGIQKYHNGTQAVSAVANKIRDDSQVYVLLVVVNAQSHKLNSTELKQLKDGFKGAGVVNSGLYIYTVFFLVRVYQISQDRLRLIGRWSWDRDEPTF